jgi:ankyrin repeat protein
MVQMLAARGADVNAQGGGFDNALQAASAEGHTDIVKLLLEEGVDVDARAATTATPCSQLEAMSRS